MLSQEQIDVLKAIGKITGEDVLELVRQAGASSKQLEALGIAHKSKALQEGRKLLPAPQGESFGREFVRCAAGPRDEKVKSESVLPGLLDRAYSAVGRRDSTQATVKSLADGTKASRGKLPNADDEALAQQIARLLKPTMDRLVSQAAEIGQRIAATEARLVASKPTDSNGAKVVKWYGPIPIFDRMPDDVMSEEDAAQKRFIEGRRNGHRSKPADFGFLWGYGRGPVQ